MSKSNKHSVRTKEWKYIRTGKHEELYDLMSDPEETENLRASRPEELARHRATLDDHLEGCERRGAARSAAAEAGVARAPDWLRDVSLESRRRLEETQMKLRSLGYVE